MFLEERKFATKWYVTLCVSIKPFVTNRVGKLNLLF